MKRFCFVIHGTGQLSLVLIRMTMNDGCSMYYLKLLLGLAIRSTTHSNAEASSSSPALWYTNVVMHSHTMAAPIASSI
jgi:hypothetical protein